MSIWQFVCSWKLAEACDLLTRIDKFTQCLLLINNCVLNKEKNIITETEKQVENISA